MTERRLRSVVLLLAAGLPGLALADPQPPSPPPPASVMTPGVDASTVGTSEDRSPFAPAGLPEFTPSRLNRLGVALSFTKDKPTASLNVRPFRLFSKHRWSWGFETLLTTDSDAKKTSLRAGYTFVPRWHLPPIWTEQAERLTAQCNAVCAPAREEAKMRSKKSRINCKKHYAPPAISATAPVVSPQWVEAVANQAVKRAKCEAKQTEAELDRRVDNDAQVQKACACLKTKKQDVLSAIDEHWVNMALPTVSVTYAVGIFHPDSGTAEQNIIASHSAGLQVAWRFAVYGEAQFAYAFESARADSKSSSVFASTTGFSASLQGTIPGAFGTSYYDDTYVESKIQRGLVLGAVYTLKKCLEKGDARLRCPKLETSSTYVGGIIGLKVSKDLQPQVQIGHRAFDRLATDGTGEEQKITGVEAVVQLIFALN